jgi:hypothetical protein
MAGVGHRRVSCGSPAALPGVLWADRFQDGHMATSPVMRPRRPLSAQIKAQAPRVVPCVANWLFDSAQNRSTACRAVESRGATNPGVVRSWLAC